jgi:hypothetical protein
MAIDTNISVACGRFRDTEEYCYNRWLGNIASFALGLPAGNVQLYVDYVAMCPRTLEIGSEARLTFHLAIDIHCLLFHHPTESEPRRVQRRSTSISHTASQFSQMLDIPDLLLQCYSL